MTSRQLVRLAPLVLIQGLVIGWLLRPYYDSWAFDRYARKLCASGKVTEYSDHRIMCGRPCGRPE